MRAVYCMRRADLWTVMMTEGRKALTNKFKVLREG